ncbi:hypothetical protein ABFX02_03G058600 [Erythranthe guttata]
MSKAKNPKLRLSFLDSFQICRPKNPSSMIQTANLPKNTTKYSILSHHKSKSFDISFPSFPSPPPYTPSNNTTARFCNTQDPSKPCTILQNKEKNTCNLPNNIIPPSDPQSSRTAKKNDKNKTKTIISSEETIYEEELLINGGEKLPVLKQKSVRERRFKRYGSKEWKESVGCCSSSSSSSSGQGYNGHSFVVVKRSADPYEDFKNSMCEMILDKQIFEPAELEQLLMSFLSLNSRMHHKVIIEAFTEILKEIFCG